MFLRGILTITLLKLLEPKQKLRERGCGRVIVLKMMMVLMVMTTFGLEKHVFFLTTKVPPPPPLV